VPFFWTLQLGKSLRYAGHATSFDQVIVDGDLAALTFVAYYVRDDKLVAVAALGRYFFNAFFFLLFLRNLHFVVFRDPIVSVLAELLAAGKVPPVSELKGKTVEEYQKLLA